MKRIITLLQTTLVFALVGIIILTIIVTENQSASGNSITTKCSPAAREWIIGRFGDAENIVDLMSDVNDFVGTRTYIERKPTDLFQYFDIDKFIENNCNGLCYDWSCFTSIVVREISAYKSWQGITPFVVDAVSVNDSNSSHSFNFVVDEKNNITYYIDMTFDNTRREQGRQIVGVVDIRDYSMEEFAEDLCGYKITNFH